MFQKTHQPLPAWTPGQLVCFSGLDGRTCHDDGIVARTRPGLVLRIELPATLEVRFPGARSGANLSNDVIITERTQAVLLDAHHLLIVGPCQIATPIPDIPSSLRVLDNRANNSVPSSIPPSPRTLIGVAAHWNPALIDADIDIARADRLRWLAAQTLPAHIARHPASAAAWCKALCMFKSQIYSPEGRFRHRWTTPDRWPHRDLWLWDSAFHAIGWRHLDPALAREILQAVFDTQHPDGFIPHMATPTETSTVTQPPILALAVGLVDEAAPDDAWLAALYPSLARYLEWDIARRDRDANGLCEWAVDPSNPNNRSDESGMDNSTRFDAAVLLDAVDFNSYLAHECEWMARFALRLARPTAEIALWQHRHARFITLINEHLWDDDAGFYFDRDIATGHRTGVWSGPGFLPLLCGAIDPARARRLLEHLRPGGGGRFDTPVPVSSIPSGSPGYTRDMWRGPMWVNLNWLVIRGLARTGNDIAHADPRTADALRQLATHLRHKTIAELERWHAKLGTFFEFYDDSGSIPPPDLPRKGRNAPDVSPYHQVIHDFGWSASLYIDLCHTATLAAVPANAPAPTREPEPASVV
ncbi:amylo-alpha-1,6-glucosidase [Geminisphaera colitermitum]|uniref:amylo-alpha-1,6-glucosidase n=1 Tax=Geminisphaera colitermitum TaxID=1148786 RepID=UPI000158C9D0|nr:trehalase family glycosidase [Geminisphaera colitermitum]